MTRYIVSYKNKEFKHYPPDLDNIYKTKQEAMDRKLKLQYSGLVQVQIKKRNVTYKEVL